MIRCARCKPNHQLEVGVTNSPKTGPLDLTEARTHFAAVSHMPVYSFCLGLTYLTPLRSIPPPIISVVVYRLRSACVGL